MWRSSGSSAAPSTGAVLGSFAVHHCTSSSILGARPGAASRGASHHGIDVLVGDLDGGVSPSKGCLPVNISYSMMPTE